MLQRERIALAALMVMVKWGLRYAVDTDEDLKACIAALHNALTARDTPG